MARIKPQALLQQSKKKKAPSSISATTVIICSLIAVLALFFLYSTYKHRSIRSTIENSSSEDGRKLQELVESDIPGYAIFTTSKGPMTVELLKDSSPQIIEKFIDLCKKGHFKGMQFLRVVNRYVIQAGNTDNLGNTEDWTVKGNDNAQLHSSVKHESLMVGTSKGKHDDKGFDLFITTAPIPDLNEKLVVFGRVVKGEDVVQEIEEVDTDEHYKPKSRIEITGVALQQKVLGPNWSLKPSFTRQFLLSIVFQANIGRMVNDSI
uniref:Peptidyl-prolyl cis-trans isomerase n=1 Tax=Linum usitatissimum TaxID=4006 RepID=A0A165G0P3_LINUS|nr:peptidyl-prolyl cis-trans isomerase-peptidyl-prolyl cis-trans isomerase [Linum usitatissimum]